MGSSISGFKGSKGVSTKIFSLILAVSYFKDMLITLINETYKLGGLVEMMDLDFFQGISLYFDNKGWLCLKADQVKYLAVGERDISNISVANGKRLSLGQVLKDGIALDKVYPCAKNFCLVTNGVDLSEYRGLCGFRMRTHFGKYTLGFQTVSSQLDCGDLFEIIKVDEKGNSLLLVTHWNLFYKANVDLLDRWDSLKNVSVYGNFIENPYSYSDSRGRQESFAKLGEYFLNNRTHRWSIPCDSRYEDSLEEPVIVESSKERLGSDLAGSSKDDFVSDFEKCFLL